jgi:predicted dehydrogenase
MMVNDTTFAVLFSTKTMSKSPVRLGLVGVGNMGSVHAQNILKGAVPGIELAALCDHNPARTEGFPDTPSFTDHREMLRSGLVEAVLVATPHYDHTTIGIDVLKAGLHLLVEKPISVHKKDCERLIAAWEATGRPKKRPVFAAMFNQRTDPHYQKVRQLIQDGHLGEIRRVNWIITDWFRTFSYYASGGWRATWGGEGGGVLLNQCPHQLDLLFWLFGAPSEVRAFCHFGKYHDIEVEDDVTAYMAYPSGATGVFIASTGEAPGTNRLEITGENGRVVVEDGRISFLRNEVGMTEFSRTTPGGFTKPPLWEVNIPVHGHGGQHNEIMKNFAATIRGEEKLIAPAAEGIHSVELANAMLLSSFTNKTIALPLSGAAYEKQLKTRIQSSTFVKKSAPARAVSDFSQSF